MSDLRQIQNELLTYLNQQTALDEPLDVDSDLLERELLDSLLIEDVSLHIESRYSVRLDAEDVSPRNFRSIERLADLVRTKLGPARKLVEPV